MSNAARNDAASGAKERLGAALWSLQLIWAAGRGYVLLILACTLLQGLVPAGFALALRGLIDGAAAMLGGTEGAFAILLPWLFLAFAISLIDSLTALVEQFASERLRLDLTLQANDRVLRHAARLDLPYFEHPDSREAIEQVQRDPGRKLHQFFGEIQRTALAGIQVAGLMAVLVWLEPYILLAVPLLAVPFFITQWRFALGRFRIEQSRALKRRMTRYFLRKLTVPESAGEIQLLGIGSLLAGRFTAVMRELRDQDAVLQRDQLFATGLFAVFSTVLFYLLFAHVAYQVAIGNHTVGDLAVFGGAVARLRTALTSGIRAAALAHEQNLYNRVLRDFLMSQPRVRDAGASAGASAPERQSDLAEPAALRGAIEVRDLEFAYPGSDTPVLRRLSLSIAPGETVAIVGENGSGKSTLSKLLTRLYDPDRGAILIDGRPITDYPICTLRRNIALMVQNFGRYEASAAENIAYGDWERLSRDRDALVTLAEATGTRAMVAHLPAGIDTPLGRELGEHDLSGGQWQRIALARTLARRSPILILDEPTSNIDAKAEHELFSSLAAAAERRTTIIISHRFSTLRLADRILVMHAGRIAEEGTHASLLAANGQYARLYRMHEHYRIRQSA